MRWVRATLILETGADAETLGSASNLRMASSQWMGPMGSKTRFSLMDIRCIHTNAISGSLLPAGFGTSAGRIHTSRPPSRTPCRLIAGTVRTSSR
jgi:hypothetical protein